MSYDPHDFIIEWRDIGAGCLLFAMALVGLSALGAPREEDYDAPFAHQTASAPYVPCSEQPPFSCTPPHAGRAAAEDRMSLYTERDADEDCGSGEGGAYL
jgi:hypothetical protein